MPRRRASLAALGGMKHNGELIDFYLGTPKFAVRAQSSLSEALQAVGIIEPKRAIRARVNEATAAQIN